MLKTLIESFLLILAISMLNYSCVSRKKITYFQDDKKISSDSLNKFNSVLKIDDLLSITVMAMDAEAAKPFNLETYGVFNDDNSNSKNSTNYKGYLIDGNGEIQFPVIGKIKLAGLSRVQASDLLREKLKEYLKDPIVNMQIINFKITVLGDVSKPGNYTVTHERITLLEAIGLAGDLNITGLRKNVVVIRDNNGAKTETRLDLTSNDIFNSPVFYLQQNDIVYVEPNRAKRNSSAVNASGITIALSITTLVITLINFLRR